MRYQVSEDRILESLIYGLNATVPVFLVIVVGYILNRKNMFTESFISVANKFTFKICLPIMIIVDMATSDITGDFDARLVGFSAVITVVMFAVIWTGAKLFIKDKSIIGAFVQASYRSSVAVMGFAFMMNIYGRIGMMPMIIIGCVPLYNICAVTVLTFEAADAQNDTDKAAKLRKAFVSIVKNPIIIGIVIGCVLSLTHIYEHIPTMFTKTLDSLKSIATPLSLIVIGASFEGKAAFAKIKPTIVSCMIKLIALPAVFLTVAIALGFRGEALLALTIMLGSPTTPSCYIMAKNMNNDGVLTSSVIAATTLISSVTLTFWIFLIKCMGLIG